MKIRLFRWKKDIILIVFSLILVVIINFPIFIVISNSLKTTEEFFASSSILPKILTFSNYYQVFTQSKFLLFLKNSLIISFFSTVLCISAASLAGYALSRFKNKFTLGYDYSLVFIQMFPAILMIIPLFILFKNLHLLNNPLGLVLIYATVSLPFATMMCRGYFDSISVSLEEAALIDGASRVYALRKIILPLCLPGLSAISIFTFVLSWNEFMIANAMMTKTNNYTVSIGMALFMQQQKSDWGPMFAAAFMTMLPSLIFFLIIQKQFASGSMQGSVKG